jgi:hypothetical protein
MNGRTKPRSTAEIRLVVSRSRAGEADFVVQAGVRFLPLTYLRLVRVFAGDLGWWPGGAVAVR